MAPHHACKRLSADRGELMSVDLGKISQNRFEFKLKIRVQDDPT